MDYLKYYQIGDKVKLPSVLPASWHPDLMDKYLGRNVTITNISRTTFHFWGAGDWSFQLADIDHIPEIAEKIRIDLELENIEKEKQRLKREEEEEKKRIKREKLLEGMIYKPQDVYNIATSIFGEELVDLQEVMYKEDMNPNNISYVIVIKFPEIAITNEKEHKHLIKDLFMRVIVSNISPESINKSQISIRGTRTTYTMSEYHSNYSHSHLNTTAKGGWADFCLGNSRFGIIMSNLKQSLSEEDWYMFFYSIAPYLAWESLDGGPYSYMSEIKLSKTVDNNLLKRELGRIITVLPKETWIVGKDISLIPTHPEIYEAFNKFSAIRSLQAQLPMEMEEMKKEQEKQISERNSIVFKKEKVPFVIIKEEPASAEMSAINKEVVDRYCKILIEKSQNFTKIYEYEKRRNSSSLFAPLSTNK